MKLMKLNFFSDSPEIVPEQSYVQQNEGVQLELVCIVHASPM